MPELRQNIATREWVIIATERAKRPEEFVQADKDRVESRPPHSPTCPFCPGNEELDLEQLRLPSGDDWQVRVVRNRYPALMDDGELVRDNHNINRSIAGIGYHEVLVESPLHNTCPALEPIANLELTLQAFQMRGHVFREDSRVEHVVYFKNHGSSAGASLVHPHTQIVAMPVVPYTIRTRTAEAQRYFDDHGACVLCTMCEMEQREQVRVVCENKHFIAFLPYAAFSPFHLWIVPRRHTPSFLDATPEEVQALAVILRDVLQRLYFGLNDPDYNYIIRTAPERESQAGYLHWYVGVVARVTRTAGFELASGMFINTALPEESARFLRDVRVPG